MDKNSKKKIAEQQKDAKKENEKKSDEPLIDTDTILTEITGHKLGILQTGSIGNNSKISQGISKRFALSKDISEYEMSYDFLKRSISILKKADVTDAQFTKLKNFFKESNKAVEMVADLVEKKTYTANDNELLALVKSDETECGMMLMSYVEQYYYRKIADINQKMADERKKNKSLSADNALVTESRNAYEYQKKLKVLISGLTILGKPVIAVYTSPESSNAVFYILTGVGYLTSLFIVVIFLIIGIITITGLLMWLAFIFIAWDYYGNLLIAIPAGIFWPFTLVINAFKKNKNPSEYYDD